MSQVHMGQRFPWKNNKEFQFSILIILMFARSKIGRAKNFFSNEEQLKAFLIIIVYQILTMNFLQFCFSLSNFIFICWYF